MYTRKTGHKQTAQDRANGKWSHENNTEAFLKVLHEEKPTPKPVDTSKPLIVINKELARYFHY